MMNTMGAARQCVAKLKDAITAPPSGCASKAKITFDYSFGIARRKWKESPGLVLVAVRPGCQTNASLSMEPAPAFVGAQFEATSAPILLS